MTDLMAVDQFTDLSVRGPSDEPTRPSTSPADRLLKVTMARKTVERRHRTSARAAGAGDDGRGCGVLISSGDRIGLHARSSVGLLSTVDWMVMSVTGARRGELVALRFTTSSFPVANAFARWAVHPLDRGHASSPLPVPVYPLSR